ncbi:MAG: hypothetical protein H7Y20_07155 [Bryobacteraceae bacterium]|nr:hypothetical protein [Bryobacteraceae bacterium]
MNAPLPNEAQEARLIVDTLREQLRELFHSLDEDPNSAIRFHAGDE